MFISPHAVLPMNERRRANLSKPLAIVRTGEMRPARGEESLGDKRRRRFFRSEREESRGGLSRPQ
jgi:hypothetical protein